MFKALFGRLAHLCFLGLLAATLGPTPAVAAPFAYITNETSGDVSVIDTATNTEGATITVEKRPFGVAITPNGAFAYVANRNSVTVSVIDTASNTVVDTIAVGDRPTGVAITPNGAFAYVTNFGVAGGGTSVSVIDTAANIVSAIVAVGNGPRSVAITPNGAFAYVTNRNSNTVSVIDKR